MRAVQKIESAVSQLSRDDFVRFRGWFDEFGAKIWDEQFEKDVMSGKLDHLANQGIADFRAGRYKEL